MKSVWGAPVFYPLAQDIHTRRSDAGDSSTARVRGYDAVHTEPADGAREISAVRFGLAAVAEVWSELTGDALPLTGPLWRLSHATCDNSVPPERWKGSSSHLAIILALARHHTGLPGARKLGLEWIWATGSVSRPETLEPIDNIALKAAVFVQACQKHAIQRAIFLAPAACQFSLRDPTLKQQLFEPTAPPRSIEGPTVVWVRHQDLRALVAWLTDGRLPGLIPRPWARLPAPAPRIFGRQGMMSALVEALAMAHHKPVGVLGAAGIGKTTLALGALHHPIIEARYGQRRLFVRCDASTSAEAVLAAIAAAMNLPLGPDLNEEVMEALRGPTGSPTLLVLDNAEVPWEADNSGFEALLAGLAQLPGLALGVTLRGSRRPAGVRWGESFEVHPLSMSVSRDLFVDIVGARLGDDPQLEGLIAQMGGLPLAIELMAHATEGQADLHWTALRWRHSGTQALKRGRGDDRQTSFDRSLECSLHSPRLVPEARALLSELATLPCGIDRQDVDALWGEGAAGAIANLCGLRLAYEDGPRIRMLAPIRQYLTRNHPCAVQRMDRLMTHYLRLADVYGERTGMSGGREAVRRLSEELGNIEAMIGRGLTLARHRRAATAAALGYGQFARFTGMGSPVALQNALDAAQNHGDAISQVNCLQRLGDIAARRSDYDTAQQCFTQAHGLCAQLGLTWGRATCLQRQGELALARSQHPQAAERFEQARALFAQINDRQGQANCTKSLGDIALARGQLQLAEDLFTEARPVFTHCNDHLGQANCTKNLGRIALQRQQHLQATALFEHARATFEQVGDLLGQANCIHSQGIVAINTGHPQHARELFEEARPMFEQVGDLLGQANCIHSQGDAERAAGDPHLAIKHYQRALTLYQNIPAPCAMGVAHAALARLTQGQERTQHLESARALWRAQNRPDLLQWLDHPDPNLLHS